MNGWITAAEKALSDLSAQTGIPFDFERFEGELSQLPDKFIVYFLVSNPPKTHYDGAESSSTARMQVSFYYRQKSDILEMPGKIINAFPPQALCAQERAEFHIRKTPAITAGDATLIITKRGKT